ncbi:MAG TPA: FkbM family methyltransferase [Methylocystis sp.]|nr:FkbM family methyltransferase [Methylocystis sp.]
MNKPKSPIAFMLASTCHGALILNRFDYHRNPDGSAFGVGFEILRDGQYAPHEISVILQLLDLRRKYFGDGVTAVDCGANIGVHSIEMAKRMAEWGRVVAFEAQERVYYALAGNIALNNCFNARAVHAAVTDACGSMRIPTPDYFQPASFGSLELRKRESPEFIGQTISYAEPDMVEVAGLTIDSLELGRIDFLKIDVEGMEMEVLAGAASSIAANKPAMLIEYIKVDQSQLRQWLGQQGYAVAQVGINFLAIHESDPSLAQLQGSSFTV